MLGRKHGCISLDVPRSATRLRTARRAMAATWRLCCWLWACTAAAVSVCAAFLPVGCPCHALCAVAWGLPEAQSAALAHSPCRPADMQTWAGASGCLRMLTRWLLLLTCTPRCVCVAGGWRGCIGCLRGC